MDLELHNKVALVTAASRGIGRAVARRLAAEGATVAISSRTRDALTSVVQDIEALGGQVSMHPTDLVDLRATAGLVGGVIAQHGRLDILVVNSPGPRIVSFLDTDIEDFATAYRLLLQPAVQLAQSAARHMAERGSGSIIFLTSTWARQPAPGGVLSSTMRAAVSALCKTMALELAPRAVRVNQVMPGATGTDRMTQIVMAKAAANGTTVEQEIRRVVADIPMDRWADPAEIADTVVFLASPRSAFTTGTTSQVDGGAVRATF